MPAMGLIRWRRRRNAVVELAVDYKVQHIEEVPFDEKGDFKIRCVMCFGSDQAREVCGTKYAVLPPGEYM